MVKSILETRNSSCVSMHAWLIHSWVKNLKRCNVKKNNSKCTKITIKKSNLILGTLCSSTLDYLFK